MGFPRVVVNALVLVLTTRAAVVAAQNITTYMPECAQSCIEQTIRNSTMCDGPNPNICFCANADVIINSRSCVLPACGNPEDTWTRAQVMSGYTQFCSDVQAASGTTTSGSTTSSPSTPAASETEPAQGSPTESDSAATETAGPPVVTISTGAKAGIGIGIGLGGISVLGALVFLRFRLRRKRKGDREPAVEIGPGDDNNNNNNNNGHGQAYGVEATRYISHDYDMSPAAELQTEYSVERPDPVEELETYEKPAELWPGAHNGVYELSADRPAELSADSSVANHSWLSIK